jgi:hypothetical protein
MISIKPNLKISEYEFFHISQKDRCSSEDTFYFKFHKKTFEMKISEDGDFNYCKSQNDYWETSQIDDLTIDIKNHITGITIFSCNLTDTQHIVSKYFYKHFWNFFERLYSIYSECDISTEWKQIYPIIEKTIINNYPEKNSNQHYFNHEDIVYCESKNKSLSIITDIIINQQTKNTEFIIENLYDFISGNKIEKSTKLKNDLIFIGK